MINRVKVVEALRCNALVKINYIKGHKRIKNVALHIATIPLQTRAHAVFCLSDLTPKNKGGTNVETRYMRGFIACIWWLFCSINECSIKLLISCKFLFHRTIWRLICTNAKHSRTWPGKTLQKHCIFHNYVTNTFRVDSLLQCLCYFSSHFIFFAGAAQVQTWMTIWRRVWGLLNKE